MLAYASADAPATADVRMPLKGASGCSVGVYDLGKGVAVGGDDEPQPVAALAVGEHEPDRAVLPGQPHPRSSATIHSAEVAVGTAWVPAGSSPSVSSIMSTE